MKKTDNYKYRFGKLMANDPNGQLRLAVKLIGLFFVVAIASGGIVAIFEPKEFWNTIVSFLSPVPIRDNDGGWFSILKLIAYIVGLIVFSGISIATITSMVRTAGERYINGLAHYTLNGHILFLGYDDMMIGTLRKELTDNPNVDIVVAVPNNVAKVRNTLYQNLTSAQMEQTIVVQASRIKVDDLKIAAQVQSAKRIYIIGQPDEDTHDAINLKSLGTIVGLCSEVQEKPLCMYYMRNHATFSLMQRQGLRPENLKESIESSDLPYVEGRACDFLGKYCEPFNFHESVARRLLFNINDYDNALKIDWHDEKNNMTNSPDLQPHLVIVGMTEMGTALGKAALMATHYPNKRLKITFVDDNAYEEMHYFTGRYKSLFESCKYDYKCLEDSAKDEQHSPKGSDFLDIEFEFIQGDIAHPKLKEDLLQWANNGEELLTIAVCTNDGPKNMAFVLYMDRPLLDRIPIWIYQENNTGMYSFLDHDVYKNVKIFSLQDIAIPIPGEAVEYELAKKVAHTYDVLYGCESEWFKKDATERWSSLYNALSIIVKLRLAGYGLRLSTKDGRLEAFDVFSGRRIDSIGLNERQEDLFAVTEHNRWNVEKLLAGFVPTTEQQHQDLHDGKISTKELKKNFIHDDIRSFDELSKGEQEKDYTLTRALVNMINNG